MTAGDLSLCGALGRKVGIVLTVSSVFCEGQVVTERLEEIDFTARTSVLALLRSLYASHPIYISSQHLTSLLSSLLLPFSLLLLQ